MVQASAAGGDPHTAEVMPGDEPVHRSGREAIARVRQPHHAVVFGVVLVVVVPGAGDDHEHGRPSLVGVLINLAPPYAHVCRQK
jgi:hypothetical protein